MRNYRLQRRLPLRKEMVLHFFVISVVVLVVHGNTLFNGFVYDDHSNVVANQVYQSAVFRKIFFGLSNGMEYLPLRDLTYVFDFAVWGGNPRGFHATNLLFYWVGVIIVYLFTRELLCYSGDNADKSSGEHLVPLVTTILFAVHPLHSEPVSAIFARNVLVSGLFFFLAGYAFLLARRDRGPSSLGAVSVVVLYICSLLAKATTITLPIVLLVLVFCRTREGRTWKPAWLFPSLGTVMVAFFILFREVATRAHFIGGSVSSLADVGERLALAIQIPVFYLIKLFYPVGLTIQYDIPFAATLLDWRVLGSAAILAAITIGAVMLRKKFPEILFGFLWYMATLIPVLNLFRTTPVVADRYLYLPMFGVLFSCAVLLLRGGRFVPVRRAFLGAAIIVLAMLAVRQNGVYRDDITLWEHGVAAAPRDAKALKNLGWSYFHAGLYGKAFVAFSDLRRLVPNDINADLARGYFYFQRGELGEAIGPLELALAKKGDSLYTLYLLAEAYRRLGEYGRAIHYYEGILSSTELDFSGYREEARHNITVLYPLVRQTRTGNPAP